MPTKNRKRRTRKPNPELVAFGLILAAARAAKGMTQAEASTAAGVAQMSLSEWERGVSDARRSAIEKLESVYGVPLRRNALV